MTGPLLYPPLDPPAIGEGEHREIAPGLLWLRMPVGGRLEAINIWALADDDGWMIVDTGLHTPETAGAWRKALPRLGGRPIRRVILTHMHPDHSGMAGWLAHECGARLWMTRLEYLTLRLMAAPPPARASADAAFYRSAGWEQASIDRHQGRMEAFGKAVFPLPESFVALEDGQRLAIGDRIWEIVVGRGHSPEHAMLWCSEEKLLLSGDQILPEISSNVSVHPLEPEADPLAQWLDSLESARGRVSGDALVLPAHGPPFRGLHARIDALIEGHRDALARLHAMLDQPRRAVDVFGALFRRPVAETMLGLATGESLAHLAYLTRRGKAVRERDAAGVHWWRAAQ